ncbi:MAG TPA: acyl-CoA dehydrogenase family protein [Pseudolabrys sp.]|nr:acyl-CoA dehydrogenase family protein [Pseudolabrys sp.]
MDLSPTQQQSDVRALTERLCAAFPDSYWAERDQSGEFPEAFYRAVADAGLLGIAMPEAYGGSGLGISEAAVLMQTIAASGACMTGASAVHMNIFGLNPVVVFGSEEQKRRMLPPLIRGEHKACFAVTEPDTGLETAKIKTKAERHGGHYVISGQKIWISTAQVADKALILARTTPYDQVARKTDGMSLFYTDLDRARVEVRAIRKMGRHAVDSNMLFIDGLRVPLEDRIGREGDGFRMILHGFNPERILIAAEAVGIGRAALRRAAAYANERVVFNRKIGANQGIQHPLAKCWMALEAANLMVMQAAALYDAGKDCGLEANAAKYLAAEAACEACEAAVLTHGGMGYSAEYHVERYLRESYVPRIAPITPQMILNFVAEKALGPPRSY